jgi:hypothetical protein
MLDLPWPQISGATAGRPFGGLSGFVANNLQARTLRPSKEERAGAERRRGRHPSRAEAEEIEDD